MGRTPSVEQILNLVENHGMLLQEVADQYGVTPAAISNKLVRAGISVRKFSPASRAAEKLPFKDVPPNVVRAAWPYRLCRAHVQYMTFGGEGLTDKQLKELRAWYERLSTWNEILEYGPHIPPSPGARTGYFAYRPREAQDDNLIIRENHYIKSLSDEERSLWKLPDPRLWPVVED